MIYLCMEVIVKANAKENKIVKEGNIYKVSLKAKAKDNEANLALIKLMKKYFEKNVRIVSGFRSKRKKLEFY